ncbi:shikimate kinase, partial [Thermodesulfobacteriota bacterium]
GVVMNEENVKNLKENGIVVWLKADVDILKERMDRDQDLGQVRPSLTGEDPVAEIRKVLDMRNPLYQRAGDFEVDTGSSNIRQVADVIIANIDPQILNKER